MQSVTESVKVEDLIYEIRGKQVMLDLEISIIKCNGKIITYYDIGNSISGYNYNFADTSAKLCS